MDNTEVAEKLNSFFIESVNKLEIESFLKDNTNIISDENLQKIIDDYANHPSILKSQENVNNVSNFFSKTRAHLIFK